MANVWWNFSNLQQLEDENISESDLEVYIKHVEKIKEYFKVCFEDMKKMHAPFNLEIENADTESRLKDEHVYMYENLEAWLVGFYDISTVVGFLTPNSFLCKKSVLKKISLVWVENLIVKNVSILNYSVYLNSSTSTDSV